MRRLQPQIPLENYLKNAPEIELRGVPLMIGFKKLFYVL